MEKLTEQQKEKIKVDLKTMSIRKCCYMNNIKYHKLYYLILTNQL